MDMFIRVWRLWEWGVGLEVFRWARGSRWRGVGGRMGILGVKRLVVVVVVGCTGRA
jgi:hypothetical protein